MASSVFIYMFILVKELQIVKNNFVRRIASVVAPMRCLLLSRICFRTHRPTSFVCSFLLSSSKSLFKVLAELAGVLSIFLPFDIRKECLGKEQRQAPLIGLVRR